MVCVISAITLWPLGLALGVVAAAIAIQARRRPTGSERRVLTPEHTVHVVEIDGHRLLVGTAPGTAPVLLCRLGDAQPGPVGVVAGGAGRG